MTEFTKLIEFAPAFDKRNLDPRKDFGIHGAEAHFCLRGPAGAVTFTLYTGWHLPEVVGRGDGVGLGGWHYGKALIERGHYPMPAQVSYHSPVKRNDYETGSEKCEWLGGVPCYGDGTFLADDAFEVLIREGTEGLWKFLESRYEGWLGDDTKGETNG